MNADEIKARCDELNIAKLLQQLAPATQTAATKRMAEIMARQQSDIRGLLNQLTDSQARERAAVEDMHQLHTLCMDIGGCCPECGNQVDELLEGACSFCSGGGVSCWVNDVGNGNRCAAFKWRGQQGEGVE